MTTPSGGGAVSPNEVVSTRDPIRVFAPSRIRGISPSADGETGVLLPGRRHRPDRRIVNLDFRSALQCPQSLIAAGHNRVSLLEALEDFHVGGSHDAALNRDKVDTVVLHDEYPLHFLFPLFLFFGGQGRRLDG